MLLHPARNEGGYEEVIANLKTGRPKTSTPRCQSPRGETKRGGRVPRSEWVGGKDARPGFAIAEIDGRVPRTGFSAAAVHYIVAVQRRFDEDHENPAPDGSLVGQRGAGGILARSRVCRTRPM